MSARLERLLAPVAGDDPAGPDTYDQGWRNVMDANFAGSGLTIEALGDAAGAPKAVLPAEWAARTQEVEGRFAETKDIWLAVFLARGGALSRDIDTAVLGAEALAGLCETLWEAVHPRLDIVGIEGRANACNDLAATVRFLTPLYAITAVRLPKAPPQTIQAIEDIRINSDQAAAGAIRQALSQGGAAEFLEPFAKLSQIEAALGRVEAVFDAQGSQGPRYSDVRSALRDLINFANGLAGIKTEGDDVAAETGNGATGNAAYGGASISGAGTNRGDVVRAIDAICAYYAQAEPSSPVRILLLRARDWVEKDFLDLLADIMPEEAQVARNLLSGRPKTNEDS